MTNDFFFIKSTNITDAMASGFLPGHDYVTRSTLHSKQNNDAQNNSTNTAP